MNNEAPHLFSYKFCNECQQVLCNKCLENHKNKYPEHNLFESYLDFYSKCEKHKKIFKYFCEDCFINLCEECLIEHNKFNIGHEIKENKIIDEDIIKKAKDNIDKMKKSIIKIEQEIKNKKTNNKFVLILKLNFIKLFVIYKFTLLRMYELNPKNYIIFKNFNDNNIEIQDIKLDEDKQQNIIFYIFTPLYKKSISGYEHFKQGKIINNVERTESESNNELIDLIKLSNNKYLVFYNFGVKLINDIDLFDFSEEKKLTIDNVYRLKDGKFLISESNKLKIYNFKDNDNDSFNFDLEFEFPKFTDNKITTFLELTNGKLIILSEGIITIFKKEDNKYIIYKNNFHLLEKICSILEFDDKSFITISEIRDEERCCHIEICDSESFSIIYNSTQHYWFPKNQYNILKINNELIIIILNRSEMTNYNDSILIFNVKNKTFEIEKSHSNYYRIIKISDGWFIGLIYANDDKTYIEQFELIGKNNFHKSNMIGFKEINYSEIKNVLISDEALIVAEKNGNIIIFK